MLSIIELNSLDYEQFIMEFGNVVEKCPAISGALWDYRPFNSISHLIFTISCIISELPDSGRCCVKLSEKKNSLKNVSKNCFFPSQSWNFKRYSRSWRKTCSNWTIGKRKCQRTKSSRIKLLKQ